MTRKAFVFAAAGMTLLGLGLFLGCSDDKSTTTSTNAVSVDLSAFDDLIAAIVPPEFETIPGAPAPASSWRQGRRGTSCTWRCCWATGHRP